MRTTIDVRGMIPGIDLLVDDADWKIGVEVRSERVAGEFSVQLDPQDVDRIQSQLADAKEYLGSLDDERRQRLAAEVEFLEGNEAGE